MVLFLLFEPGHYLFEAVVDLSASGVAGLIMEAQFIGVAFGERIAGPAPH